MSEDDSRERVGLFHSISPDCLKPGDHVYSYRALSLYAHHGIYVGEGECEVIHFSGRRKEKSTTRISSCTLKEFCKGEELHLVAYNVNYHTVKLKFRGTCHTEKSDRAAIVLNRARYYLKHPEEWPPYNLINNNCENFAFYCKTWKRNNPNGQAGGFVPRTLGKIANEDLSSTVPAISKPQTTRVPGNPFMDMDTEHLSDSPVDMVYNLSLRAVVQTAGFTAIELKSIKMEHFYYRRGDRIP